MIDLPLDTIFHIIQLAVILISAGILYGYIKSTMETTVKRVDRLEEQMMDIRDRLARLEGDDK